MILLPFSSRLISSFVPAPSFASGHLFDIKPHLFSAAEEVKELILENLNVRHGYDRFFRTR